MAAVSPTTKPGRPSFKTIACVAGLSLALAQTAHAGPATPIALYDLGYGGVALSVAPSSVAADVTAQDITTGASGQLTGNPSHGWYALDLSGGVGSEAEAVSAGNYFQVTVSATTGYALDLTSLTFDAGEFTSDDDMFVRSSLDGYTSDLLNFAVTSPTLTAQDASLSSGFSDLSAEVTFRVYGYGPSGGYINFNDVSLNGTVVTATPEPGTPCLVGGGALALLGCRRRKA
jgi:hypothetical protein